MRSRLLVLAAALLLSLSACAAPKAALDPLLKAQVEAAAQVERIPDRPAAIFIGAAMDGTSTAFVGDVRLAELQLRHHAPQLAVLRLANGKPKPDDWPRASSASVGQALASAGTLLPADGRDARAVVLLSSHGGKGLLSLAATEGDNATASARQIEAWLAPLGRTPTLLIISACYSGSLIPALQRDNRIVLTASAADRSSYGCHTESRNTFFVDELLAKGFDPDESLMQAMERAKGQIAQREAQQDLKPSMPQMWVGPKVAWLAARPMKDWFAP